MLLPEEVAYGRVPVEGRAATGVLQQETLHPVHRGDKLHDGEGSAHGLEASAHTSTTEEIASRHARQACNNNGSRGVIARDPVRVGEASDNDELCHCSRRWSQRRAFDSNGNASRVYASTEQPDSDGARPRHSLTTVLPLNFHFTPPSCQL